MPVPSRPTRSCCARCATARPIASSTSTRPHRGRVGAIAKGVRRTRSRFGGRLEPFSGCASICHEGRGELLTITGARRSTPTPRLRDERRDARLRRARLRRRRARVRDRGAPPGRLQPALPTQLALLAAGAGAAASPARSHANALAFRLKLLVAAGLAPALGACASCGEPRAPRRLLGRRRRRRLQRLRGRLLPDRRGDPRLHDRGARPHRSRRRPSAARPGAARGRARDRRDARAPRAPAPLAAEPRGRCCRRRFEREVTDRRPLPQSKREHRVARRSPRGARALAAGAARATARRSRRAPIRRGAPAEEDCGCARRSSATATGSSTARRSGASSTRRRCSSRPRATTTARA